MTLAFGNICVSQKACPISDTSSARDNKISKSSVLRCWLSLLQNYVTDHWHEAQAFYQSCGQLLNSVLEAGR